jgi:toxin-antitoxin system PIN domain toxin
VILVDTNLLVYAQVSSLPQHERARSWLDGKLNDVLGVGMAWPSLLGFVRIVSNPRIFENPISVQTAWDQVRNWMDLRPVFCPEPTQYHMEVLQALIPETGKSDLVPDAHLAALAIGHGLVLQTTDRDFARFRGLRWENPLEETS